MSQPSPDAAETIIHVMEGLATGHGSDRGATLRDIVGYRAGQNRNSSSRANQQQATSTNENKEEENDRKKDTRELNTPLAELLPLTELWDALSQSLCKSLIICRGFFNRKLRIIFA